MSDEMAQRPHKRTGVWSSDTVKQKTPSENNLKRYSRNDVTKVMTAEDDDDTSHNNSRTNYGNFTKGSTKSDLLKLPALNAWNDINIGLLLTQFNEPADVVENDLPWNQDLLFAEVTNQLNCEKTSK